MPRIVLGKKDPFLCSGTFLAKKELCGWSVGVGVGANSMRARKIARTSSSVLGAGRLGGSVLQSCSVLHRIAVCCNVLQRDAVEWCGPRR